MSCVERQSGETGPPRMRVAVSITRSTSPSDIFEKSGRLTVPRKYCSAAGNCSGARW